MNNFNVFSTKKTWIAVLFTFVLGLNNSANGMEQPAGQSSGVEQGAWAPCKPTAEEQEEQRGWDRLARARAEMEKRELFNPKSVYYINVSKIVHFIIEVLEKHGFRVIQEEFPFSICSEIDSILPNEGIAILFDQQHLPCAVMTPIGRINIAKVIVPKAYGDNLPGKKQAVLEEITKELELYKFKEPYQDCFRDSYDIYSVTKNLFGRFIPIVALNGECQANSPDHWREYWTEVAVASAPAPEV